MNDNLKDTTPNNPIKKHVVIDNHGHSYELTGKLGQGGQGVVCTTNHSNILVKICTLDDETQRNDWTQHIRWIMRQPIDDLAIAKPVAIIEKPRFGYVMELMEGLTPIKSLLEMAEYSMLDGQTPEEKLSGFLKTGGLKRRVNLIAKLARLLADLHGRGMAFGDLSPDNVFVSKSLEHFEVWLIDIDNLCINSRSGWQAVYTPDYGAPEILRKESGINTLTDSWSFAVLAFRLLTMSHPLKGDFVNEGGPEIEEKALRGEFPWVDNPDDTTNKLTIGLPRELVLTDGIKALFHQCFEIGMNDPGARPSLSAWASALESALSKSIICEGAGCGNSFFVEQSLVCPFCDYQNSSDNHLKLAHCIYEPPNKDESDEDLRASIWIKTDDTIVLSLNNPVELRRLPISSSYYSKSDPLCSIELITTGLRFNPHAGADISIQRVLDGSQYDITKSKVLKTSSRRGEHYVLHLGNMLSGHPTWTFKW